jgi:excisionase family DNA binding protein
MRARETNAGVHPAANERVVVNKARAEARITTAHPFVRASASDSPTLLTVQEVAGLLRVPASWIYDHVRPGCPDPLPAIKLGKYLRFRMSDVAAYIDSAACNGRCGKG